MLRMCNSQKLIYLFFLSGQVSFIPLLTPQNETLKSSAINYWRCFFNYNSFVLKREGQHNYPKHDDVQIDDND